MELVLDGFSLTPEALCEFSKQALDPLSRPRLRLAPEARHRIDVAAEFVERVVREGKAVYGINTGFGKFAEVAIAADKLVELQENLIRSHAAGAGEPLSRDLVLSMWVLRLNTICRGNSGVRSSTLDAVIAALEKGFLAQVPSRGSVGASGDLAPSAHATLALLGEGRATLPSGEGFVEVAAGEGLKKIGLSPLKLGPKEGLSLINGTQLTTAIAVQALVDSENLLRVANLCAALSIEGLRGSHGIYMREILESRNQPGAVHCGQEIASWIGSDTEISRSHDNCGRVQDPYSLRCAPQVHGSIFEEISHARTVIARELNASTDNPLLFPERGLSVSGGNFHAAYTAKTCDNLASALSTLAAICERRIALAMSPESSRLPAFLIRDGGLNSGFMMAHVTAAALTSECKSLSFPASVDSIPTSDDREDHVSMGPIAGHKLRRIVDNLRGVLAIEVLAGCQAIDLLRPLKTSSKLEAVHRRVRSKVAVLEKDRVLADDIAAVEKLIHQREIFA